MSITRNIILLVFIFAINLTAQNNWWWAWGDEQVNWFALDLDGSTEYAYVNNPTGLDLNRTYGLRWWAAIKGDAAATSDEKFWIRRGRYDN